MHTLATSLVETFVAADMGFGAPWGVVGATVTVSAAMYVSVLLATRVAGRRTIAQLSAFDAVITVAVGTMLGSTAISSQISYAEGVTATLTLFALQVVVGAVRSHVPGTRQWLDFEPITVISDGRVDLPHGPFGSQLTIDELRSQLRHRGVGDVEAVERAVLEPIGGVSVSPRPVGDAAERSIEDLLHDHLGCRRQGDLEGDLSRNYADDVVVLSQSGLLTGHAAVRRLATELRSYEVGRIRYEPLVAGNEIALVRWSAAHDGTGGGTGTTEGIESFVVRSDRIVAQTVLWRASGAQPPSV